MRTFTSLILVAIGFAAGEGTIWAQVPGVTVSFRNETPGPVIVLGTSKVNNMPRRGQPIFLPPGRTAFDVNVPAGVRFIAIYDGQQTTRVLLPDFPVLIQNRDLGFAIHPSPTQRDRVILVPEPGQ